MPKPKKSCPHNDCGFICKHKEKPDYKEYKVDVSARSNGSACPPDDRCPIDQVTNKRATVNVYSRFTLTKRDDDVDTGIQPPIPQDLQAPNPLRRDVTQYANGSIIAISSCHNAYILVPFGSVFMPPTLSTTWNLYPYDDASVHTSDIRDEYQPATQIVVQIYDVNGTGESYIYFADVVFSYGKGGMALLRILANDPRNACTERIKKCHGSYPWGCSSKLCEGDDVFFISSVLDDVIDYNPNAIGPTINVTNSTFTTATVLNTDVPPVPTSVLASVLVPGTATLVPTAVNYLPFFALPQPSITKSSVSKIAYKDPLGGQLPEHLTLRDHASIVGGSILDSEGRLVAMHDNYRFDDVERIAPEVRISGVTQRFMKYILGRYFRSICKSDCGEPRISVRLESHTITYSPSAGDPAVVSGPFTYNWYVWRCGYAGIAATPTGANQYNQYGVYNALVGYQGMNFFNYDYSLAPPSISISNTKQVTGLTVQGLAGGANTAYYVPGASNVALSYLADLAVAGPPDEPDLVDSDFLTKLQLGDNLTFLILPNNKTKCLGGTEKEQSLIDWFSRLLDGDTIGFDLYRGGNSANVSLLTSNNAENYNTNLSVTGELTRIPFALDYAGHHYAYWKFFLAETADAGGLEGARQLPNSPYPLLDGADVPARGFIDYA